MVEPESAAHGGDPGEQRPGRSRYILLVTPYSLESNPYIRLLVNALRAQGWRIEVARGSSPVLLWRSLRRHGRPAVVHLQWQHPYFTGDSLPGAVLRTVSFLKQWALLRALGTRFVWTVHNLVEHERRQVRWELLACRVWARLVDRILAHCGEAAAMVAETYRVPLERVTVVPHGFLELAGGGGRAAARLRLGLAGEGRCLLYFGRIRPYKGVDRLLDAFAAIDSPDARLVVVGFPDDPALASSLLARAARDPRVSARFEAIEDAELAGYLAACDAVVLPYRDSLTSGAAVVAASHGRAVVAPALGCLRDFPPGAALLYDPEDEGALERTLRSALDSSLDAIGEAARDHVAANPWSRVAARTGEVYRSVLGELAPTAPGPSTPAR